MSVRQGVTLGLLALSALGLAFSAEFAGRWPFVQPPLAAIATLLLTLLWLRDAPIAGRPAVPMATSVVFATAMWALSAATSVALHAIRGEPFDFFEQFDSRIARALALVVAHAVALGGPTGLAAGLAASGVALLRRARLQA